MATRARPSSRRRRARLSLSLVVWSSCRTAETESSRDKVSFAALFSRRWLRR